jgi:hypothetical protein
MFECRHFCGDFHNCKGLVWALARDGGNVPGRGVALTIRSLLCSIEMDGGAVLLDRVYVRFPSAKHFEGQ